MAEKKMLKLVPYEFVYTCDVCKNGNLEYNNADAIFPVEPPHFRHICTNCGATKFLPTMYPAIRYEREPIEIEDGRIFYNGREICSLPLEKTT